jgi:PKD repeat protein
MRRNVENLYHWVAGSVPHGIPTHITYKRDQDQWGTADYWQLSNRTLTLGHGDDEDQAILLASLIRAAGGPSWRVRIAKYGVYRLEFPWWGFGLVKNEKERLFTYYAVEIYDISSNPLNLIYHDWWTPLHPTTTNLLGWPLPFFSCEQLGNSAFENPVCARRLKPEGYFYERVAGDPKSRFNYFPQIPRINETVRFDASTSTPDGGYINKHCWDFGDGTSVNVTNGIPIPPHEVYHSYGTAGTYAVTLTVFDSEARSNTTSKTIQVQGLPDTTPPDIAIISPANTTYATTNIDLNYTINEPPSWTGCTIDDGTYVANATVVGNTTLYFTNGVHNIQLFANDTSGNMGASQKIYFTVSVPPPVANFTYDPKVPKVGETVTFDGSSSSSGGIIVSYQWDFGDGQTSFGQTAAHTYATATSYVVTLNVTDSNGLWDTEQKQVQIVQPHGPKAEFTVVPETANIGQLVKFDATTSQAGWNGTNQMPIIEYRWDFGDGNKTTVPAPTIYHTFGSSGIYYPTLTVYASGATPETDATTHKIVVMSVPVGGYSVSLARYSTAMPSSVYLALLIMLSVVFTAVRRNARKKNT